MTTLLQSDALPTELKPEFFFGKTGFNINLRQIITTDNRIKTGIVQQNMSAEQHIQFATPSKNKLCNNTTEAGVYYTLFNSIIRRLHAPLARLPNPV